MHKPLLGIRQGRNQIMRYLFVIGMISGMFFTFVGAPTTATTDITSVLCSIINTVKSVIGILALLMFILGGTMYAIAHFLPAAGNLRASTQGWGMGMVMAGFIAFVIYLLAGYVINILINLATGPIGRVTITC